MKKSLKQTVELFKLDWQRIFHNKLTLLLIIALMIIPSLYAWFNIAALWDPYSNTKDISIAVYSEDKTVTVLDKEINIGEQIVKSLKKNETVGWRFVNSKAELDKGVKSGKFYGGIYLPANFSENLVSFIEGDIKKPEIKYSVNQKINAIAPKITDKGANTIKDTISQEFVGTVSETLLKTFNVLGYDLDSNMASINKITSKVLLLDDNLDKIDGYTKEVIELNQKMPEYKEKLAKANEFIQYIPEVNKMGAKLLEVNQMMPQIKESGKMILTLQDKIPEIENAGRQIKMIDDDFDDLVGIMNDAIEEARKGVEIVTKAQAVLPDVQRLAETANQVIPEVSASITEIQNALPQIADGVGTGFQIISAIARDIQTSSQKLAELLGDNELTPEGKAEIKESLANLNNSLTALSQIIDSTVGMLQQIQNLAGSTDLQPIIDSLLSTKSSIPQLQNDINFVIGNIDDWSVAELKQKLNIISQKSGILADTLSVVTPEAIKAGIAPLLAQLQELLAAAQSVTGQIVDQKLINQLDALLTQTTLTVTQGITFLEKYQAELPAIKQEIHSANEILNGNMPTIVGGINRAADLYRNDLPELEIKLNQAASFVENDLPRIEADLTKTMEMVNQKMPQIEEALSTATNMIQDDWPNIRSGVHRAAGMIRQGQKDVDLKEIIKLLKSDANAESDFISNPVSIDQKDIYPVPNNGSASAPFYTALCLWVGAVLFSSIASTEFQLSDDEQKKYSKRQQFLARMATYLVVGLCQALIVSVGNYWLLGTYAVSPLYTILFALLVGFTFMMMVYVLVSIFGNLGKGAAIIILVLSISGGGGNYPIQMSGKFFQFINPLLPFTHAVNLLREPVGGIYWPNAWQAILILVLISLAFLVLGLWIYPKFKPFFKKLNENLHEGKILH